MKVENFKRFSLKRLHCEARAFSVGTATINQPFFYSAENALRIDLDRVANGHFVLGRDVLCEFADYCPLAVSMPPTMVCLQCKAAVPVRWKTCEHCDHVF